MMGFRFLVGFDNGQVFHAGAGFGDASDAKRYALDLDALPGRPAVIVVDTAPDYRSGPLVEIPPEGPVFRPGPMIVDHREPRGLRYTMPREGFTIAS